jgi:hypothetical protein
LPGEKPTPADIHNEGMPLRKELATEGNTETNTSVSDPACELTIAASEFRQNYELFVSKHRQYITLHDEIDLAARRADSETCASISAEIFSNRIVTVLETMQAKEETTGTRKWTRKLGAFLKKVYPIAKLCIGVTSSFAEASNLYSAFLMYR